MPKIPDYEVFTVTEPKEEGQKAYWTKIGSCWKHTGKDGYSINLNALPINGRLVLIPPKPKDNDLF